MNTATLRTQVAPGLLGILAPLVWLVAAGWWATSMAETFFRWLEATFQIKGDSAFITNAALEAVFFGLVFGLLLRAVAGARWKGPTIWFSVGFLLSFYSPALFEHFAGGLQMLGLSGPYVLAMLGITSFVHWCSSRVAAWHDA
jgi:hypothetical protein